MTKVLVIDDDPDYSAMIVRVLARADCRVALASTLGEGMDLALRFEPDVVLLDVGLPDGSGLDAIRQLKDQPSGPEIIVVTAAGDTEGAEVAIRAGAWDYLCKAGSHHAVVLALQRVVEYRRRKTLGEPRLFEMSGMIGTSPAMRACYSRLAQAAGTDANVLITGESGTGKELLAGAVHKNSKRSAKPFVIVDCAALPETLVESVLFGHKKGAFTGAATSNVGLLEQADGGAVFLDEVGELPLTAQKAFLRALQEHRFRPVGGSVEVHSDFRLIAATNRSLDQMVKAGVFREDLLYRLRALTIELPPLRHRGADLHELTLAFVARICGREGHGTKGISPEFHHVLAAYPWPGNVRELIHALEHAVAAAVYDPVLYPLHLPVEVRIHAAVSSVPPHTEQPDQTPAPVVLSRSLQDYQREATTRYLRDLMCASDGDIAKASDLSGLSRSRLYALLKEHGVARAG